VNVIVLLAKRWVRNSNVFGIAGKGPFWSFDAHVNFVAICDCDANSQYRVPGFGSKRYFITVFFDGSAVIGTRRTSHEGSRQQSGQ
jgi:hypothetical protein